MPTSIQDWGAALMTSFTAALALFFAAVPHLIAFVLILVIGWFVASLIARLAAGLLRAVRFNELAKRSGFADFVDKMGVKADASSFIAGLAKWFIRLIVMVIAFDALGLPAVSDILQELMLWLPNVLVALVVLVLGGLAAKAMSNLVRGSAAKAGLTSSEALANFTSVAVWAFAVIVAVNQLGIAATLVNTLFMGLVAGLALAGGLAFGLGGRETAAELIRRTYELAYRNRGKVETAFEEGTQQVKRGDNDFAP